MSKRSSRPIFGNRRLPSISMFFFVIILGYVIISAYISSKDVTITGYQVKSGVLSDNRLYTGIALRHENIVHSDNSGYINYLIREGERVGYNNLVYCIDETGKVSDIISKDPTAGNSLNENDLDEIKQDIIQFSRNFDEKQFQDAGVFSSRIQKRINQMENQQILSSVSDLKNKHINDIIDFCRADASGVVVFSYDGYENFIASDLTVDDFKNIDSKKTKYILNDDLITSGDFVYKYIDEENWSIVICVPNEDVPRIEVLDYVKVNFRKDNVYSWGKVKIVNRYDDHTLIELSFTNSMVSYAKERFIDIELVLEEDAGLKIPVSSIVDKEFYLVDSDYVYKDNSTDTYYVLRREVGDVGYYAKKVTVNVLKEDKEEKAFFVDKADLTHGDVLYKMDASLGYDMDSVCMVGNHRTGFLPGVYSINKGYADFKRIEIKYRDSEYAIVANYAAFGLREYDFIALDASLVNDKDFVY